MFGDLAVLTITSLFSIGTYAYSLAIPPKIMSPLPITAPSPTPTSTPTPTPTNTPTPTMTPTPTPTEIPTPTPTPLPVLAPSDIDSLFSRFAGEYSVDQDLLKRIARCESGFNSNAENGDYVGMFQFATSSWTGTRGDMNMDPNPDLRRSAEEAIKTAAFKISRGGVGAWPSCH